MNERLRTAAVLKDGRAFEALGNVSYARELGRITLKRPIRAALRQVARDAGGAPPEFMRAVKAALRDYHHSRRLQRSVLLSAGLPTIAGEDAPLARVRKLRAILAEAVDLLGAHGRDGDQRRVLQRTYLQTDGCKQLAIAADLGMGYSTYRRLLREAREALSQQLWDQHTASHNPKV